MNWFVSALMIIGVLCLPYLFLFFEHFFSKWLIAIVSVLSGSKEDLKECNLCDDSPPPPVYLDGQDHWRQKWNGKQ